MGHDFSVFVVPFLLGVAWLLIFSVWKYVRWVKGFDKLQQKVIRKNIWSWKFIPAIFEAFNQGLLHLRISRKNLILGYMHRSLAFGWFLLIVVGFIQALKAFPEGHAFYYGIFFNYFVPDENATALKNPAFWANLMDILLLYVFSGLLLAMFKKIWSRPLGMRRTPNHTVPDRVAKLALWCIFPARLLAESATYSWLLEETGKGNGGFLIQACGTGLHNIGIWAPEFEYSCWMFYSLALGVFFALMPFSRYMHIFTEIFLIYFRRLGVREHPVKKTGYTMFELSACPRCGLCIDGCPINRELHIVNIQGVYMLRSIRNLELNHLQEPISENCLMCGRCEVDCPVDIDLNTIRRQVRIRNKREIDVQGGYDYLRNVHSFNAIGRVAYFGGCMGHLTPGVTEAMQKIFEATGRKYWYMDEDKSICCGRPLLQQGFTNQAAELRQKNTDLIASSGATALITSCPICYRSFKEEYKLNIPVYHHTEYIDMLLKDGKLKVRNSGQRVSYHDPCELGRGCGIYDQPREVLKSAGTLLKTSEEREFSLCCGFNLSDLAINADQKRAIRDAALNNLKAPHPDVIATACPACKKALTRAENFPVKDVAEIVAENIVK